MVIGTYSNSSSSSSSSSHNHNDIDSSSKSQKLTKILKKYRLDVFETKLIDFGVRDVEGLQDLEMEEFQELGCRRLDMKRFKRLFQEMKFEWKVAY